jgi:glucose/arabinose dehydrogenase
MRDLRGWAVGLAIGLGALCLAQSAAAASPSTPTITEPSEDGILVHPADVHMEAGGFADPDGDTHACTDWEIAEAATSEVAWQAPCATGLSKVHIHLGDGTFVNSYAGKTRLNFDSQYTLRVRFHDSAAEVGAWAERPFGTYPPSSPGGAVAWTPVQPGYVVEEVVGPSAGLQLPVNIAFVPNPGSAPTDPLFYISELYGKIRVVTRDGAVGDYATGLLNFDPTGVFPGSGEQGLTGLLVDPATGDLFASLLYDANPPSEEHYPKVIRLHSDDGGHTASTITTVLDMRGELQGQSHQISNLSFGPDGKLYVHMGDGFDAPTALNLDSHRGKVLRINMDGSTPTDNPFYDGAPITARDRIFAYGFRNPFGGAWRASNGAHYGVENGPAVDRFARITAGTSYGYDGTNESMSTNALYNWSPPHAPVNIAFVQPETFAGSGFPPSKMDHAFVTESGSTYSTGPHPRGKRVVEFSPDAATGELGGHPRGLVEYTGTGQATAAGLAAGPDGLYFTDLYRDQPTTDPPDPTEPGARVLRLRYVPPPMLSSTIPASPANENIPRVTGSTAPEWSTVNLYTDQLCTSPAATGSAAQLASPGIAVTVPDNSTTSFYATGTDGANTSECSDTSVTYVEDSAPPVVPPAVTQPVAPFDLKAAVRRCRRKFDRPKPRARCVRKAKRKAAALASLG